MPEGRPQQKPAGFARRESKAGPSAVNRFHAGGLMAPPVGTEGATNTHGNRYFSRLPRN